MLENPQEEKKTDLGEWGERDGLIPVWKDHNILLHVCLS